MKKQKRVKITLPLLALVLIAAVFVIISGRSAGDMPQGIEVADPNAVFRSGDDVSHAAISESAWFYYEGNLIKYYNPDLKKSFVLCSKSNCRHNNDSCEAYFANDVFGDPAICGVAADGGFVYVLSSGESEKSDSFDKNKPIPYQIVRIDLADGTRKTIAKFNNSMYAQPGDEQEYWDYWDSLNVYVCNGYLWFLNQPMMMPGETWGEKLDWQQSIGINLQTGDTVNIGRMDYECRVLTIGAGYITYAHDEFNEAIPARSDFYDLLTERGALEYNGVSYTDYTAYSNAVKNHSGFVSEYYIYRLDNGSTEKLFESESVLTHALRDYSLLSQLSKKTITGSHDDCILIKQLTPDDQGEYDFCRFEASLYNVKDGSSKKILATENGHMPHSMIEGLNGIQPDGSITVYQYNNDRTETGVWIYNVEDNTNKYLYIEQELGYIFRVEGIYRDGYIGTTYQLNGFPEGAYGDTYPMRYAWISAADYLDGNMENMIRYEIK